MQELGQCDPINGKYLCPPSLLAKESTRHGNLKYS
jgi:hypothetical protein